VLVQRANRFLCLSEAFFGFPEKALCICLGHEKNGLIQKNKEHATGRASILSQRSGVRFKTLARHAADEAAERQRHSSANSGFGVLERWRRKNEADDMSQTEIPQRNRLRLSR
jgi:hypothetical protein